jgi:hypothetical protein
MSRQADAASIVDSLMLPAGKAAQLLGMPRSRLLRETKRGNIAHKRIGVEYWYNRTTLLNYAATLEGTDEHHPADPEERRHGLRCLPGPGPEA